MRERLRLNSSGKRLNEMNRLSDMGHFPAIVNAGATANVLATICVTRWLVPRHPQVYAPVLWVAVVLAANLLPVLVLRLTTRSTEPYPSLAEMKFFSDQHRFSDWVYMAASANMAFWILVSWIIFSISDTVPVLLSILAAAFLLTFSPILVRGISPR